MTGLLYRESFLPGAFTPNPKGTVFKYARKRTRDDPMIYKFVFKERFNRATGQLEYIVKPKLQADLSRADPLRNTALSEDELSGMSVQVTIGPSPFSLTAQWDRTRNGWFLADKYF